MLRRVPPVVLYSTVAALCFFVGTRIEPVFEGSAKEHAAEARALSGPAKVSLKPGDKIGNRELLNTAPVHDEAAQQAPAQPDAKQPDAAQAVLAAPPAPAPVIAETVPAATPAPAATPEASEQKPEPTTVTGQDPDTGNDFVELKDLPEVQGQGGAAEKKGRDVDMIGEEGLPAPEDGSNGAPSRSSGG